MNRLDHFVLALCAGAGVVASCSSGGPSETGTSGTGGGTSSTGPGGPPDAAVAGPCKLPGSVQFVGTQVFEVPGGKPGHDLSFLKLPSGFCAHWFGNVGDARQLRFAPGGELFVSSPTGVTTGGNASEGLAAIVVLPDDDHDGYADETITFLPNLPLTQGML